MTRDFGRASPFCVADKMMFKLDRKYRLADQKSLMRCWNWFVEVEMVFDTERESERLRATTIFCECKTFTLNTLKFRPSHYNTLSLYQYCVVSLKHTHLLWNGQSQEDQARIRHCESWKVRQAFPEYIVQSSMICLF